MKRKTEPVQFVWVQNDTGNYSAKLKESLKAKKRVISQLMDMALAEQQKEPVPLFG